VARDLAIAVREFVVEALATAPEVMAEAGNPARVYGPSVPAHPVWPFVRVDLPVITPDPDGCGPNGSRYTFNAHGFARGDDERNAARLGAAMSHVLDELAGIIVADPEASMSDTVWTATQTFRDTPEADGWHTVVSVYSRVSG
jgi:hypothetical protein